MQEYSNSFHPDDASEWVSVLAEVRTFLEVQYSDISSLLTEYVVHYIILSLFVRIY